METILHQVGFLRLKIRPLGGLEKGSVETTQDSLGRSVVFSKHNLYPTIEALLPSGRRPRGQRRGISRPQGVRRVPHRHPEGSTTLNDEHATRRHVLAACRAQRFWC